MVPSRSVLASVGVSGLIMLLAFLFPDSIMETCSVVQTFESVDIHCNFAWYLLFLKFGIFHGFWFLALLRIKGLACW